MRTLNTFILSLQDPSAFPAPDPLHVVAAHPEASHSLRTPKGEGPLFMSATGPMISVTSLSRTFHSVRCAGSREGVSRSSG